MAIPNPIEILIQRMLLDSVTERSDKYPSRRDLSEPASSCAGTIQVFAARIVLAITSHVDDYDIIPWIAESTLATMRFGEALAETARLAYGTAGYQAAETLLDHWCGEYRTQWRREVNDHRYEPIEHEPIEYGRIDPGRERFGGVTLRCGEG